MRKSIIKGDPPKPRRLALLYDNESMRLAVLEMLRDTESNFAVMSYPCRETALRRISLVPPAAVMLANGMSDLSAVELTYKLKTVSPHLPILILTNRGAARRVVLSLMAGASAHIVMPCTVDIFQQALLRVMAGTSFLCSQSQTLLVRYLRDSYMQEWPASLTPREKEVALCLLQKLPEKQIAGSLGIKMKTLHAHIANLYGKVHVHERDKLRTLLRFS